MNTETDPTQGPREDGAGIGGVIPLRAEEHLPPPAGRHMEGPSPETHRPRPPRLRDET